ncbi:hypothetical protein M3Y99_00958300 [Aphelenchoides fujianensis]|nr:hypothetical protein M3Y99_00958300 [Aphelenchoides fujianensis]
MPPARTVVVDNTEGYERQIEELKEAARSTIQSYKEQLERKERALDDCRKLVEKMTLAASVAADLPPVRLLRSEEEEERERQLISLRWSVAELEEANARLADQLREAHASSAVAAIVGRNVAVQTNPAEQPPVVEPSRTRDHSPESNGDSADGSTQSGDSGTVDDHQRRRRAPDGPQAGEISLQFHSNDRGRLSGRKPAVPRAKRSPTL